MHLRALIHFLRKSPNYFKGEKEEASVFSFAPEEAKLRLPRERGQTFSVTSLRSFYSNESELTRLDFKLARLPALHTTKAPMLFEVIALEGMKFYL